MTTSGDIALPAVLATAGRQCPEWPVQVEEAAGPVAAVNDAEPQAVWVPELESAPERFAASPVDRASSRNVSWAKAAVVLGAGVALVAWLIQRTSPEVHAWGALATGLTTGGLSCLAVQGGLLASAVAGSREERAIGTPAVTICWFLGAKLVAYTILGGLLGYFGSLVQMSFGTRGVMQILIGLFMLATALRMVWPHPWLRFVVLEPPAVVRRAIRKVARSDDGAATPIFLGALTVLVPCGVTQAMMVLALGTANPAAGAMIMLLFTLGTVPLFFALSYAATTLGQRAQRQFNVAVAVLIFVVALMTIRAGMTLTGHPLGQQASPSAAVSASDGSGGPQVVKIAVDDKGYRPSIVKANAGQPVTLSFTTRNLHGCTSTLVVPSLKIERALKSTGTTNVQIPARSAGTSVRWMCGMGMYSGSLEFSKDPRAKAASSAPSRSVTPPTSMRAASAASSAYTIKVSGNGYSPNALTVPANKAFELVLVTRDNTSCTRTFVVPDLGIEQALPATGRTLVKLPAQPAGTTLTFTCGMGMYSGTIRIGAGTRRSSQRGSPAMGTNSASESTDMDGM